MIRVLHILHSMNRGGTEAMLMNYYRNIDRQIVQFDFLLTEQSHCQYEDEIVSLGGKVFRVPMLHFSNPMPYLKGVKSFLLSHPEYRIVHSHTSSKSAIPLWVAKRCKVPIRICHAHSRDAGDGIEGVVRNMLGIWLKHVATDYMACGVDAALCWYGKKFVNDGKVIYIQNAIDNASYSFHNDARRIIRHRFNIGDDTSVIGLVARFHPVKNHFFALDLLRELLDRGHKAKLMLVGDGEMHDEIVRRIKELDMKDSVIFTGVVSDVYNYVQSFDLSILPSFNEGLGVALIEAQASGLTCIASLGVPKEADVTGNVSFLPLQLNTWSDCVDLCLKKGGARDENAAAKVKEAGYDIQEAAVNFQNWYVEKIKTNC